MQNRYIANIVIEANTPLKIGSSDIDMLQDSPVQKDWNELPMILGTSIAGVLRKEFDEEFADNIFGSDCSRFIKKEKQDCLKSAKGSRIIISNALLCNRDMQTIEKLEPNKNTFLKIFDTLPIREHTAITDKGVAKETSKFDEEVVYKGTRFKFRIELIGSDDDKQNWLELLKTINSKIFRLGSGSTKGFGDIKVLHEFSSYDIFDIRSQKYQEKSSSLNTSYEKPFPKDKKEIGYVIYTLKVTPENFFMFGSGFGDDDADMTPVYEKVVDYKTKKLSEKQILIPASSIKGAVSHRTAFYYNKSQKVYAEKLTKEEVSSHLGENNDAVKAIFGHKKELAKDNKTELGQKGKILISDCFKEEQNQIKTFDHVSIDRFTGGAIDGALFQEKTIAQKDEWQIEILLRKGIEKEYVAAFENALEDICSGMLPLGGATTKGHGVFTGKLEKYE